MIRRLDAWLGLHVFHPPIIAICQRTGWTQDRVGWDCLFLGYCGLTYDALHEGRWGWAIFYGAFMAICFLITTFSPKREERDGHISLLARIIVILAIVSDTIGAILDPADWHKAVTDLFILFGFYAFTITTIPPRKKKEPKRKVAAA